MVVLSQKPFLKSLRSGLVINAGPVLVDAQHGVGVEGGNGRFTNASPPQDVYASFRIRRDITSLVCHWRTMGGSVVLRRVLPCEQRETKASGYCSRDEVLFRKR